MTQLEKYREDNGLIPADMARLFGVAPQNYNNWVYRRSLPKAYFKRAEEIMGAGPDPKTIVGAIPIKGSLPLISYIQAGQWSEAVDLYQPGYAEDFVPTTQPHSKSAFALRVEGYSMTLPPGVEGRSFPPGIIIFVDPEKDCEIGDFVVARIDGGHVTFKKMASEEGRPVLVPLNPDRREFPVMRDEFELIGRVFDASYGGF